MVVAGIFGYDLIMRCQQVITIVTGVITVGFFILGWGHIDFSAIDSVPAGSLPAMLGCCFFVMTGFGLGWVNIAADYSRYLPRKSSNSGIVFWTTFGASIANVLLIFYGLLLAGSNAKLAETSATTRSARWPPSCPSGTSSRTPSSPCWASCPAPSWTTTPTDWHC